jgi:protein tyrosine phosphatase (PTP) superfamily phosphohydrolase (DUF442 family)
MKHSTKRKGLVTGIAVLAVVALCVAAGAYYWVDIEHRFAEVTEGQVYRSGAMPVEKLKEKIEKYGIRTVIDFRKEKHKDAIAAEHEAVSKMGRHHFNLPTGQVPNDQTIREFLAIMDKPENRPVLIHCYDGVGRAVLFSALYRIEYEGWSNERARQDTRWCFWGSDFSLEGGKGRFLSRYKRRKP